MLEKIENNLREAYENLDWKERRVLLDNLNNSLLKGEINFDEFEKSAVYLSKSCPDEDANNWNRYWLDENVKFTKILVNEIFKEKIHRYFYQGMMIEGYLGSVICFQGLQDKDIIGDTFFHSMDDYQRVKEELCKYLRYYGLTPQQEQEIMQGKSLTDNMEVIFGLSKSKELRL